MISRRDLLKLSGAVAVAPSFSAYATGSDPGDSDAADYRIDIAPVMLDRSARHRMRTVAYNGAAWIPWIVVLLALATWPPLLKAQANYEIQVYGADTVPADNLMVELHSNYTFEGRQSTFDGVYPTNHQAHETLELTEGLNSWSEVGFYVFTSEQDGHGVQWVGDHVRPRIRVPESWGWPVGVSLSTEIGYQRAVYSPNTWSWEIRPIIDKAIGRWYFAINPALDRTLHGPEVKQGFGFAPSAKIGYDFSRVLSAGIEWYAAYGALRDIAPVHDQQQQVFIVTDLNVSPVWEINIGVGIGATAATDHLIVKAILGRRFDWGRHSPID